MFERVKQVQRIHALGIDDFPIHKITDGVGFELVHDVRAKIRARVYGRRAEESLRGL